MVNTIEKELVDIVSDEFEKLGGMIIIVQNEIDREFALEAIGDDPLTSEIINILDGIDQG